MKISDENNAGNIFRILSKHFIEFNNLHVQRDCLLNLPLAELEFQPKTIHTNLGAYIFFTKKDFNNCYNCIILEMRYKGEK